MTLVRNAAFRILALSTSLCASVANYAIVFSISPQMVRTYGFAEDDVGFYGGLITGQCTIYELLTMMIDSCCKGYDYVLLTTFGK